MNAANLRFITPSSVSESHRMLAALIEVVREAVIGVDSSLRIAAANVKAVEHFSKGDQPLPGRRLSEIIRDLDLHRSFRKALEENRPVSTSLEIIAAGRRSFEVFINVVELGSERLAIGFFDDVTHIERLEKVRQEFLSNISHELRTPLTSIIAFVETLEDGAIDDPENNRRFLGVIRRNAERMHTLISDLLELSLIESGNISLEKVQVRLASMVADVFDTLSAKAAERQINLRNLVLPEDRIAADPGRLEQMLTNLVDNGIKFNKTGGFVEVSFKKTPARGIICVADSGDGITGEHLDRIFERFYRLDRGRTRQEGGTGLGLAIVKHLARLHGGEISVSSELGKGTVFSIELPNE